MNSSGDTGETLQHIFNKDIAAVNIDSKRPVTSGGIQDKLRDGLDAYSENNPEPPTMKN
ncbi:hypothetical protein [Sporomusa aerivorans]|uniref:hypothetical protein n=1 Tax=Sporomusa aerivorans TaxID=204936 RepID=UPI00352BA3DA